MRDEEISVILDYAADLRHRRGHADQSRRLQYLSAQHSH